MKLTLIRRKQETPDVESFIFEPHEALAWKAGQFLHYTLHHEPTDDRGSDRWFTAASAPFENVAMITTRFTDEKSSSFKKALRALNIGESIEVSDVDGDFIIEDAHLPYVFIAGGIGITPFHSILKEADHNGMQLNATLLYSNRDEHIPFKEEFESFAERNPNFHIHYFIGQRIDENAIRKIVLNMDQALFYVSGPEPMVESFGPLLTSMGIPSGHIKQDWFPGYPAE